MAVIPIAHNGTLKAPTGRYDFLIPHLLVIRRSAKVIAALTFLAMLATGVLAKFVMQKTYRGNTVLRPVTEGWTSTGVLSMVAGVGIELQNSGENLLGGPGQDESQEYIAIIRSYSFTQALIERFKLQSELTADLSGAHKPTMRDMCDDLIGRLDAKYDLRSGNILLSFEDTDPRRAERILGYYLQALRDKLRGREAETAKLAVTALQDAANRTPDVLLRAQIYELMAKQTQRERIAQLEADFAFRVIDAPNASDKKVAPKTLLDCLLAGFLVCMLSTLAVFAMHHSRELHAEMQFHLDSLNHNGVVPHEPEDRGGSESSPPN